MKNLLFIIVIAILIYFVLNRTENFEDQNLAVELITKYLNSEKPDFFGYSGMLNTLKNKSVDLGREQTFNFLMTIKKAKGTVSGDDIKKFIQ